MNFDGSFRRVGRANVEPTRAFVEKLSEESWYQDTVDVHGNPCPEGSQVIYLVHDEQLRHNHPVRRPALEVFDKVIRPVLAVAADQFDGSPEGRDSSRQHGLGYFVRARLLRVLDGAAVDMGADTSFSETHSHRVHVPVITNDRVAFTVGDESLCIPAGEIYEVNNCRPRGIANRGAKPCVHLVLEYVLKGEIAVQDSDVIG